MPKRQYDYNVAFKLIDELKPIYTWDSIKDTLNAHFNLELSESAYRKVYNAYVIGREQEYNEVDNLLAIANSKQHLRTQRKILGIERSINNEQIRDISINKLMTDQILDSISKLNIDIEFDNEYNHYEEKAHIFTMADLHYDGNKELLNVFNKVYHNIHRQVMKEGIEHLYLFELGDIIEGASLRTSQLMAVKSGMVNQVIEVSQAYVLFLSALSKIVDITFVCVTSSNHSQLRNLGTQRNELVEEDLMLVFVEYVKVSLPELKIISGADVLINIMGFNMFIEHGHLATKKESRLERVSTDRHILIDYIFLGHFHHMRDIDLHSANNTYDKKAFYVPALTNQETTYEKDRNLSSMSAIGYYQFDSEVGHIGSKKIIIK